MGSCLSLSCLCPARYLQHHQELGGAGADAGAGEGSQHQGNTFSHFSLAGSRQGSRVSCVELYPSFVAFEDTSSL